MDILILVAAPTGGIGNVVGALAVALLARDRDVQAKQWKSRQVMVEVDDLLPALRNMTFIAPGSQPSGVDIACLVTAHALG